MAYSNIKETFENVEKEITEKLAELNTFFSKQELIKYNTKVALITHTYDFKEDILTFMFDAPSCEFEKSYTFLTKKEYYVRIFHNIIITGKDDYKAIIKFCDAHELKIENFLEEKFLNFTKKLYSSLVKDDKMFSITYVEKNIIKKITYNGLKDEQPEVSIYLKDLSIPEKNILYSAVNQGLEDCKVEKIKNDRNSFLEIFS